MIHQKKENNPNFYEKEDKKEEISAIKEQETDFPIITKVYSLNEDISVELKSKVHLMAKNELKRHSQINSTSVTSNDEQPYSNMPFKNAIDISLAGLNLPSESIARLQSQLREEVEEDTKRSQNSKGEMTLLAETSECIYTPIYKGTRINVNSWILPAFKQETEISMSSEDKFRFWWDDNFPWTSQQLIGGMGTSHNPSIAVYNGRLFMVWKAADHAGIYYTTFYNNQWAPQQLIGGMGTSHNPSIAVYDEKIFMVWKGVGGDTRIFYTTFYNNQWAPQQLIAGPNSSHNPSIAVYNGRLFMVWKGAGGDSGIYYTTFYNNQWAPQQLIGGMGTSHNPSIAVYAINNQPFLFMVWKGVGGDTRIFYTTKFLDNPWAPQQLIAGPNSSHGPSIAVYNGRLFMVWKGAGVDSGIWFTTYYPNQWAQKTQLVESVGTSHNPSIAVYNGRLFMVWKGAGGDSGIYYNTLITNMSLNEMWVGLKTGGTVSWAKEIEAWNDYPPGRRITSAYAEGFNSQISWMYIVSGRCMENTHTPVFRKPKLFGVWTDMYNLGDVDFWRRFGGKSIRFTWIKDR